MRVNADSRSRHDVRYKRLARRLGICHAEAYGRAIWVWFELYERAGAFMSAEDIDIAAELDGFAAAMVSCELAEETPDGIRVRGNERAGWVERKRESSSEGGRVRAATATRKSGRFVMTTTEHQHSTSVSPATPPASHQPYTSPPALAPDPAPALAPVPDQESVRAKPEPSPDAVSVSRYLLEAIRSHKPDAKDGSHGWARDIDLAIRVDGRTPDRLRAAIDFAHRSTVTFWRANVLSGSKLRAQLDTLEIQAASRARGSPRVVGTGGVVRTPDELAEWARQRMEQERREGKR